MRILVIGGTGFIGPHVVGRLVARGHQVTLFHRGRTETDLPEGIDHVLGDRERIGDHRAAFARIGPGVVLDMRPMTGFQARAVIATFRGLASRVVALSSGDVYRAYGRLRGTEPGPPEPVPIAEEAPLRERLYPYRGPAPRAPEDPMRWADDYDKIPVERAVLGAHDLPGTVLRLPMVYGPGDEHHRLYPYLKRMDDGRPAILLDQGRAPWRWTRGYVEDVAAAIVRAVESDRAAGRVYNVGEPDALAEADWVRAIGQAAGWRGEVVVVPRDRLPEADRLDLDFDQHLITDTSRIRAELGFAEAFPREEALGRAVAWERAHPPVTMGTQAFDYAAEDALLAEFAPGAG